MATNEDIEVARRYHEATKHSPVSVHSTPHFLDWDNQPRPFKVYEDRARVPLPAVDAPGGSPLFRALLSAREADDPGLDLATLGRVLHHSAGITKRIRYPAGEMEFRAAACTGALYHIDLYVVSGKLPELDAGVYHYDPRDETLGVLREGDFRAGVVEASGGEPDVARAPVLLVCATTFWRNAWKYRERAYRHVFWDGGTLLAQCLAMCSAVGVRSRLVLGFVDRDVDALLGLDGKREASFAIVALGRGGASAVERASYAPLEARTLPLSRSPIDYPLIEEMHEASGLESPERVREWRARALSFAGADERRPSGEAGEAVRRLEGLETMVRDEEGEGKAEPLEAVIRRRGSARRFGRESITLPELSVILASASCASFSVEGLPARRTVGDLYVIANDVDGLPSGSYHYDGRSGAVQPLEEGDFRDQARYLDLEQPLAGEAAANVYVLVDLDRALDALGNRGYRLCQLDGGLAGGRVYLAAYALGLAATGLTFYDDAVTEFFSPHAEGRAVMFLTAVGRRAPRRRRILYQR